jgi:hypothetical protein
MINIFYDTEFVEDSYGIELLSIGMVAQGGDGHHLGDLYLVRDLNRDLNPILRARVERNPFLVEHVLPEIEAANNAGRSTPISEIPGLVSRFVTDVVAQATLDGGMAPRAPRRNDVRLWAYYAAYDHVVLARLFGTMVQLPGHIPMYTHDLMQEMDRRGVRRDQLPANNDAHNALADALWCARAYEICARTHEALFGPAILADATDGVQHFSDCS